MEDMTKKVGNMDSTAILETISRLYYAVYVLDIANDAYYAVRASQGAEDVICGCHSFTEACRKYVDTSVFPDDGAKVRRFASTAYMASVLTPASPTCRVELRRGKHPKYEWIAIIFMATEFADGKATKAVVAAENIDGQKNSTFLGEQTRMQNYARKLAADTDRRIRSVTERSADERSAILLKMNARGRLLYLALQKTSTQAFEYEIASNRLTTILEWSDTGESVSYDGGPELISDYNCCSDRDALAIENAFNTAISGEDAETEYASNLDENRRWKRMKLYVMRVDGKPTGTIVGVVSDITREKTIARHMQEEQEFRKAVLGSSAYGMEICLTDNTWRYLWRNTPGKFTMEGGDYDRDLLSANLVSIVAKEDYSGYFASMNRESLLEAWNDGTEELYVDYRAKNDSGEYVWFRNVIHIAEADDTGKLMANIYVSDINEQKLRELEDEARKRELEDTARAEKRANELKSRFLTNMSHELRTPLNAILGMSQLSLREEMSNEARSFIHGIRTAGTGLLGVVNGVLDLAKIETGRMEISESEYKPMELMNDLASMFEYQANDKALAFSIVMEPKLPAGLVGDEGHLRQVFINLINNALKYTESGSVTVSLGYKTNDEGGIILTAGVRDTGVGIRRERLPRIFNEYDAENADEESATGVGLSISRRLVRLMGGELTAESEYGEGSTFRFEVPQSVWDPTPNGQFKRSTDRHEDGAFWNFCAPDATVMMVDDNPVNLRVGIGLLHPFGMRIITAGGGAEALEILKKEKVDLILMDHMMPEMDGLETAQRIRAMGGGYKKLPILALTANAMKGVKEMLLSNGMDDYMAKPVEMWELSEKLRRWLPEKKVIMQTNADVPVTLQWPVNLPYIPGVDVAKGLSYTCTFDDYMTCLRDFWSIIPEKSSAMERLAEAGEVLNYTAEAHSLKSSARLIGADNLSDFAAKLEKYGHENRLEDIRLENPKLMTIYRSYSGKLEPYVKSERAVGNRKVITVKQFAKRLKELGGFVKEFDCDSADHWSDDMRSLRVPEEFDAALEKLHMYILAAKFSSCTQLIDELLEKMK